MGTITSGVGLISGLDIEDIVTKLMAIESAPKDQLETRMEDLTEEKTALMQVQALVMAVQISASGFNQDSVFQQKTVTTSNEAFITATANKFAAEGNYSFKVNQLASNHHFISRGYSSMTSSIGQGTVSFEIGNGQLNRATDINFINGQQGFQRGTIKIQDRSGNESEVDLKTALTVQDVVDTINKNKEIDVTASVKGDSIVITDTSGGSGELLISDIGNGTTAYDLGITNEAGSSVTAGQIIGRDIVSINLDTRLTDLNDGNGVRTLNSFGEDIIFQLSADESDVFEVDIRTHMQSSTGDPTQSNTIDSLNSGAGVRSGSFKITDQNGRYVIIDMAALGEDKPTMGQLKEYVEAQADAKGMDISFNFSNMNHITVVDNSKPLGEVTGQTETERRSEFIIEDLDGGHAASDLGIVGEIAGSNIVGDQVWFVETVGDIVNAINNHWNNPGVEVSIDAEGNGLQVTNPESPEPVQVIAGEDSFLAEDLGLTDMTNGVGRRLVSGLNTVMLRSLNGGSGGDVNSEDYGANRITSGNEITLTDRDGNTATVDLNDAFTVQDVIDAINDAGTNIRASANAVGNGLLLEDTLSSGSNNMQVADVGEGTIAQKLGITIDDSVSSVDSGNLQLQYISGAAKLTDLNYGEGVTLGRIKIKDGTGRIATYNLAQDGIKTLEDVIEKINNGQTNVVARVNDTGDGLILVDTSEGESLTAFTVEEQNGGSMAKDLGILGTAQKNTDTGQYEIDGSYEFKLDVGGGDGIEDIVQMINKADRGVSASIVNDGANYRISFNSTVSGAAGVVHLDAGQTNLSVSTISEGRDAILFLGEGSDEHPLLITSSSNTIEDAIKGTTLDLHGVSGDETVTIGVEQDLESITTQISTFVEAYNTLMKSIEEVTSFDTSTYEKGILFADHTTSTVKDTMLSLVQQAVSGVNVAFSRLSSVGITFGSLGNELVTNEQGETVSYSVAGTPQLIFDQQEFLDAFASNPDDVTALFTKKDVGIGDYFADELDRLAGSTDSTIKNRLDAIDNRGRLFEDRLERLQTLLDAKETRLYKQYYAMEETLANLQSQQSALSSLSSMAASSSA